VKTHNKYIVESVVINSVLNFFITLGIGYFTHAGMTTIPMVAPINTPFAPNIAGDIIVGSFILGWVLGAIVTYITRHNLTKQHVEGGFIESNFLILKLPNKLALRFIAIGLAASAVGVLAVLLLALFGVNELPISTYGIPHGIYVAVMAGFVTLVAARRALLTSPSQP